MYSYEFFKSTPLIVLHDMFMAGEIQEWQVPEEYLNGMKLAADLALWTLEEEICFIIDDLLSQDIIPTYNMIEENSSVSYGFDTLMESLECQELIEEVNGAYILTEWGKKRKPGGKAD